MKFLLSLLLVLTAFSSLRAAEPPVFAASVDSDITASDGYINLAKYMLQNTKITNTQGASMFELTEDGIVVGKTGLYRLNFFQGVFGNADSNSCTLSLSLDDDINILRYLGLNIGLNEAGQLSFTQILRINAGQKITLIVGFCAGSLTLPGSPANSGFTIEKL